MLNYLINFFKRKSDLELKIELADKKFKETGRQYFVMPFDGKKKYMLVHGASFMESYNRKCKKTGAKKMSYIDMVNMCAYKTPNGTTSKR